MQEAMEIVRQFEGSALADLKLSVPDYAPNNIDLVSGNTYYYVDPVKRQVRSVSYFDNLKDKYGVMLSLDEARQKAADFARARYRDFATLNLIEEKLLDHGVGGPSYLLKWAEVISEALTPNSVVVNVNPANGRITSYTAFYEPIQPFAPPSVSAEAARTIAKDNFGFVATRELITTQPVLQVVFMDGTQRLIWKIEVVQKPTANEIIRGRLLFIDAYSGLVAKDWIKK